MKTVRQYPQHSQYMSHEVTFQEYYESVAAAAGISYDNGADLPRIKAALEAGDEHLNTIPLAWWDRRAAQTQQIIGKALKLHGDFYSLAGGVCVHKAAARAAATKATA